MSTSVMSIKKVDEFCSVIFARTHHAMKDDLLRFAGKKGIVLFVNDKSQALVEFHPKVLRPQHRWINLRFLDTIDS